jgi:hypothetical protein
VLHEWGLGGRRFGTVITWFLIGGDLYTAYTFIAVPALAFGAGALAFFAVPIAIVAYPIFFLVVPRIWYLCHKHRYITAGDLVRGRFGNRWLALAVTITGIVAYWRRSRPPRRRGTGRGALVDCGSGCVRSIHAGGEGARTIQREEHGHRLARPPAKRAAATASSSKLSSASAHAARALSSLIDWTENRRGAGDRDDERAADEGPRCDSRCAAAPGRRLNRLGRAAGQGPDGGARLSTGLGRDH